MEKGIGFYFIGFAAGVIYTMTEFFIESFTISALIQISVTITFLFLAHYILNKIN